MSSNITRLRVPPYWGFSAGFAVVSGADVGEAAVGPVVVCCGAVVVEEGAHAARSSNSTIMLPKTFPFIRYLPYDVVPRKEVLQLFAPIDPKLSPPFSDCETPRVAFRTRAIAVERLADARTLVFSWKAVVMGQVAYRGCSASSTNSLAHRLVSSFTSEE